MAKKKKSLQDNMNEFKLPDGTKFYAKDNKMLYFTQRKLMVDMQN